MNNMEEYIAISSKDGRLSSPEEPGAKLITFSMEGEQIVGVIDEVTPTKDSHSLLKWFSMKGISRLYVSTISPFMYQALTNLGIIIMQKDEVEDDPFYNRFIFD